MKLMVDKGGATLASVVAATWKEGGVAAFFNGNLTDVLRTAPQKSVQLAACALPRRTPALCLAARRPARAAYRAPAGLLAFMYCASCVRGLRAAAALARLRG